MRQLTFIRPGVVEWHEVTAPRIDSPLSALVRPLAIGRCDLDTAYVKGAVPLKTGEPIGHEMIGEVVETGEAVRLVRPGQQVVCSAQISCGLCRMCRRGFTGRCQSVPFAASYGMGRDGGFGSLACDLARIPYADAMLVPLPPGMSPVDVIGAADMALDAWRAVGPQLAQRPGARVLVMGGQVTVIGLYAAGLAVALGAGQTVYADDDPDRCAEARRFGATACAPGEIDGAFEIVVEASGDADRLRQALAAAEPEALVTSVAIHFGMTALPLQEMYWKGVSFTTGRPNTRAAMEPLLAACNHRFRPSTLTQTVHRFDEAPAAWLDDALRVVAVRAPLANPP